MRLPAELRTWWGWHDGAPSEGIAHPDEQAIGPVGAFLPLAEAVRTTRGQRAEAEHAMRSSDLSPEILWKSTEIALTHAARSGTLVCDCAGPDLAPTRMNWPEGGHPQPPGVASLGRAVTWWIEAMEPGGGWFIEPGHGWVADAGSVPSEREVTLLV